MTHLIIVFFKILQKHYRKLVRTAHMSYMLSLQNIYLFRATIAILESEMSTYRSGKTIIAKTNDYSKSNFGKGTVYQDNRLK